MPKLIALKHKSKNLDESFFRLTFLDMFWFNVARVMELKEIVCTSAIAVEFVVI